MTYTVTTVSFSFCNRHYDIMTHSEGLKHTYLLNVAIEAEEAEDAGAVHLG